MKILVTGATGFIGSAVMKRLASEPSYQVVPSSKRLDSNSIWQDALHGVDVVIHCAARVHVMHETALDPLAEFRKINVEGTRALAQQAAAVGVKRFIFLSSIKVNGEFTAPGKPFTAEDKPAPQDAYGQSKLEAEQALLSISRSSTMESVVIRPPLVYGPGVKGNFAVLVKLVASGIPLPLGSVQNLRSFVALDNLVDLIHHTITHPNAANQTFLVSDGEDVSTPTLLRMIAGAMNLPSRLFPCPTPFLVLAARVIGKKEIAQRLCANLQLDIHKTCETLDWKPPIGLQEGLRHTAQNLVK